jgi:hypothetical protein
MPKLIVSYMLEHRAAATAESFMRDVAGRIANRIQLTTDGHRAYAEAVEDALSADIDYAMLVKRFTVLRLRTRNHATRPLPASGAAPEFSRGGVLILITSLHRLWKDEDGDAKKLENHGHMVAVYFVHYNYRRVHKTAESDSSDGSRLDGSRLEFGGIA